MVVTPRAMKSLSGGVLTTGTGPTSGTTVADVVASLGFVSGGRFSVEYKKLFDESPSDPRGLARARGADDEALPQRALSPATPLLHKSFVAADARPASRGT
ncbi:hypothetical protein DAT35_29750 [Vitiosangium sp. GDMCC 1.1324]|nr:hypothetical protein DAT35_29750 [Vitiosangium sp. GDMCC 1.1324]